MKTLTFAMDHSLKKPGTNTIYIWPWKTCTQTITMVMKDSLEDFVLRQYTKPASALDGELEEPCSQTPML